MRRTRRLSIDPQMIDKHKGFLDKAAFAGRHGRIEQSLSRSARDGHDTNKREALVTCDLGIAYYNAGPFTALFVSDRRIEFYNDHGSTTNPHARSSIHPSPGIQRRALPARLSRSTSGFSSGRLRDHSSMPCSASSALSGWGFSIDRLSSSRRRRLSSWRTASATNLLRFFSRRSISLTRSSGKTTVTCSTATFPPQR